MVRVVLGIWWVVCRKRVSKTGVSNYTTLYLQYVITCPCPWYLLANKFSYIMLPYEISRANMICDITSLPHGICSFAIVSWICRLSFWTLHNLSFDCDHTPQLTHWGWDKIAAISQTTFSRYQGPALKCKDYMYFWKRAGHLCLYIDIYIYIWYIYRRTSIAFIWIIFATIVS